MFVMRLTVILSDLVYFYACFRLVQSVQKEKQVLSFVAVYVNWGLFLLDNIHFQYNSMMYGILIMAIVYAREQSWFKSALMYAVLLNFKHLFIVSAPAFGILYLKMKVFNQRRAVDGFKNFLVLGG